jgi:hypothetical protein
LIGAVEEAKVELIAKDGDVKVAVDTHDEAQKELKH